MTETRTTMARIFADSGARGSTLLKGAALLVLFFGVFLGLCLLGIHFYFQPKNVATYWPASGVFLAALFLNRIRFWAPIALSYVAAAITAGVIVFDRFPHSAGFCESTELIGAGIGALLLRWYLGSKIEFSRLNHAGAFVISAAIVSTSLCALVGVTGIVARSSSASYWPLFQEWWFADALGVLLTAPAVLVWTSIIKDRVNPFPRKRRLETALLFGLLLLAVQLVFGADPGPTRFAFDHPYIIFPLLLWAAVRFEAPIVTIALLVIGVLVIECTDRGNGPFIGNAQTVEELALSVQAFLTFVALSALGLLAITGERKRIVRALQSSEKVSHDKEIQLDNLLSNVDAIILEGDPFDIYYVGGQVEKILGYPKEMWFEHPGGPVDFRSELLYPDDAGSIEICRQAIERGEDHSFEYRLIAQDGRPVWFYDSVMVETRDGKPVKTRSVMIDITDRKAAEEALRESKQRLDLAVSGASDGLWDANLNTGEEHWSPRFKQLLGYKEDEIEATHDQFQAFLHPDDKPDVLEAIRLHMEENRPYDLEFRMKLKSGEYRWFQSRGEALRDENGTPYRMAGSVRDITERKQAEVELRENEGRIRALLEGAFEGIVISDEGKTLEANHAFADMFGYAVDEIIGLSPVELTIPESAQEIARHIANGDEKPYEIVGLKKDGTTFDIEVLGKNCMYRGRAVRITAMRDITERKRAEVALRKSEERLDLAVRGTSDGLWDWTIPSGEVYWSPRFKALLGYAEGEIEASYDKFFAFLHPDDTPDVLEAIRLHMEENRPYDREFQMQTKGGEYRWFHSRGEALRDENGTAYRMAGSIRDITERKQAEEEARKHRDELAHVARISTMGEMATGIAHELNQPLAAISLYSDAARTIAGRNDSSPQELQSILGKLEDQAIRAGDIVRRLRDFVKKTSSVRVSADLNTLVQDVAKFVEPDIHKAEAMLVLKPQKSSLRVLVDQIQIQQVLVNLIRNAVDAMQDTPAGQREVIVSTRILRDGRSEVAVSDVGKGLAQEELDQAFNAFFSTKQEGMGMGLPISRSIVEAHGGRLWAEPNTGPGVTFGFTIPLEDDHGR